MGSSAAGKLMFTAAALAGTAFGSDMLLKAVAGREEPDMPFLKKLLDSGERGKYDNLKAKVNEARKRLEERQMESVRITSRDGLELFGRIIRSPEQKRVVILMHGYRSSWFWDFALSAEEMLKRGCTVILPDERAHGQSQGKYITFGIMERFDCADWAHFAAGKFGSGVPIYLCGLSMGATAVLMASILDLPTNVRGIIADCGFTSPKTIITRTLAKRTKLPGELLYAACNTAFKVKTGDSFSNCDTLQAMKYNRLPVMFAHGKKDDFVPFYMTRQNYDMCRSPKMLVVSEDAGHAMTFLHEREKYLEAMERFFEINE